MLRHETATKAHYEKLHPPALSFDNRMRCLHTLREIGYQVGAGFMVGSPFQTKADLARDLCFIRDFKPDMCGIGPFIPHKDTPFAQEPAGTLGETLRLLSIIRLLKPNILLPATTALGTYALYDNKICTGEESAQCKNCLARRMESIGYEVVIDRGDIKQEKVSHAEV